MEKGKRYDITVKDMFSGSEGVLIRSLTGIELKEAQPLNIEFPRIEARASDLVVKGFVDSEPAIVHIEFQSENDPKMPIRMLRYATDIYETHDLFPYQLVLYIGSSPPRMEKGISYSLGKFCKLEYEYSLVDIGALSRKLLVLEGIPELYAFLPLAERESRRKEPEKFLEECVKLVTKSSFDLEDKRKALLRAEILAGLAFERDTIERIFREAENMLDLTKSAGYQRIIEKGIQQGIQQGIEEGTEKIVIRLLTKKFRELPVHYVERIKAKDIATLEKIAEDIFEIEKLEDLERYLN